MVIVDIKCNTNDATLSMKNCKRINQPVTTLVLGRGFLFVKICKETDSHFDRFGTVPCHNIASTFKSTYGTQQKARSTFFR